MQTYNRKPVSFVKGEGVYLWDDNGKKYIDALCGLAVTSLGHSNQLISNVFRAKGILWFRESERRHVFHLAGKRISIDDSEWGEERKNQLVFIGKELNKVNILSQLNACIDK